MALLKRKILHSAANSGAEVDYKFSCRCCLKTDVEYLKLDSVSVARSLDPADKADKIPLLRCLLYCVSAENAPELPQYICIECSKSLQVAYYFLKNAQRAHEILCRKLCPKGVKRLNGTLAQEPEKKTGDYALEETEAEMRPMKTMRHECQVCGVVLYNRLELKQHIRQHAEGISYNCKLCSLVTLKQRVLLEHYMTNHGLSPRQAEEHMKLKNLPASKDEEPKPVCTLEDMELLIPTVLTPDDYAQPLPAIDPEQLRDIEQQLAVSMGETAPGVDTLTSTLPPMDTPNMSIGTEYLVLPDGSLQQVNGSGVVIEYIDDSKPSNPSNINISLHNLLSSSNENEGIDMDVNELIVEETMPQIRIKPKPTIGGSPIYKHKCKLCPKTFSTVARLKSHQLTHSNLPKFFCDQCDFYSLRSADLIQHYKMVHHRSDENGRSGNNTALGGDSRVYSCDLCLFETHTPLQLRSHYTELHKIQTTEVQLRPSWTGEAGASSVRTARNTVSSKEQLAARRSDQVNIPVSIKYPTIVAQTQVPVQQPEPMVSTPTTITQTGGLNVLVDTTPLFYAMTQNSTVVTNSIPGTADVESSTEANNNAFEIFPEISEGNLPVNDSDQQIPASTANISIMPMNESVQQTLANASNTSMLPVNEPVQQIPANASNTSILPMNESVTQIPANASNISMLPVNETVQQTPANTANISIFGDMQEFIDNTDVAAICTIPADDMPVVDGDDIVIDNNNISLDFDAENLFEEFEEEEDAVGEEEEEDDNDDENDNNDAATDQNLLLTSDDDDVDDFDDEQSKHLQKPYCIYCNKKFTSQYKFENHMFVHRGLAPYRCELCTNLYNLKRLLIRHYKSVHKRMPTRDMVQAKGDKVSVARSNIEKLYPGKMKKPMLMCAKCPFECEADAEMKKHLNAHHGINDGVSVHANEVFIIRKLPFECPRCIRSFAAKSTLSRHLQRSHLVDTIIEMPTPQTADSTTTATSTATSSETENPVQDDNKHIVMVQTDGGAERMTTDASGNSVGNGAGTDDGSSIKMESAMPEEELDPVTLDAATAVTTTAIAAAISAAAAASKSSESPITTTTSSSNTLFPTPTPFDFDYDFMGETGQRSTPNPHSITRSTNMNAPSGSSVLNGSDKLLTTAALAASPVKGLRSNTRLPRHSIYTCKVCNTPFDELGKLVKHETEFHSNTEPSRWGYQHKCAVCNTSYRTLTLLKFHMKRHTSRRIQCRLCPKTFVTNQELDRHTKGKHGRDKPLRCSLDGCRKMFAFKHHLVRHQNATHLDTPHKCPVCDKELQSRLHLKNHMIVHKGAVCIKCPKCDRPYMRPGRLQSHVLNIHNIRLTAEELTAITSQAQAHPPTDLKVKTRRRDLDGEKEIHDETAAAADNSK
ncbi:uncharacterized protein LOC108096698 isoform X2 [Drosophila ficusphila]|uniref:uncharacterized protein LOC108096698 isoform X2 n=1 Tax=Drosophila ficusphila TaxID=30025 RepID=UPI0007E625D6|nr:uncharacterized protein LOC108096698 isoform X2 [Drosophila ficusphila]